jgi:hypothetical protein
MHMAELPGCGMRVILFQDRFAAKVKDGSKWHTIRKSARCRKGDQLSLRRWTGRPYRSRQEVLREAECLSVLPIALGYGTHADGIRLGETEIDTSARAELARGDGFACATDMLDWFREVHGLPFVGEIIYWADTGGAA